MNRLNVSGVGGYAFRDHPTEADIDDLKALAEDFGAELVWSVGELYPEERVGHF